MSDLATMTRQMRADAETWFPALHQRDHMALVTAYTLGLAGEAGEVANEIKKLNRDVGGERQNLPAELADVLTYLLLLADECNVDIEAAYRKKRTFNRDRWEAVNKKASALEPGDEVPGSGTVLCVNRHPAGHAYWYVTYDREGHAGAIPPDAPAWVPGCNVWTRGIGNESLRVYPKRAGDPDA